MQPDTCVCVYSRGQVRLRLVRCAAHAARAGAGGLPRRGRALRLATWSFLRRTARERDGVTRFRRDSTFGCVCESGCDTSFRGFGRSRVFLESHTVDLCSFVVGTLRSFQLGDWKRDLSCRTQASLKTSGASSSRSADTSRAPRPEPGLMREREIRGLTRDVARVGLEVPIDARLGLDSVVSSAASKSLSLSLSLSFFLVRERERERWLWRAPVLCQVARGAEIAASRASRGQAESLRFGPSTTRREFGRAKRLELLFAIICGQERRARAAARCYACARRPARTWTLSRG